MKIRSYLWLYYNHNCYSSLFIYFWKPLKEKSEEEYLYDRLKKSGLSGKKEIIDKFFKTTKLGNGSMEKYSKWAIIELKTGDQETEILALKVLAVTHRFVPPALEQSIVDNVIPMLEKRKSQDSKKCGNYTGLQWQ